MRAAALALVAALAVGSSPPTEWLPRIAQGQMLFFNGSDRDLPANTIPVMANGFVGTTSVDDTMYIAGVFNGYSSVDPSHRAAIPSTVNVVVNDSHSGPSALDIERATFYRRSTFPQASTACSPDTATQSCVNAAAVGGGQLVVEQRWYAHRRQPHLLVMDLRAWVEGGSGIDASAGPLAVLALQQYAGVSKDISMGAVPVPDGSPFVLTNGSTLVAETNASSVTGLAIAASIVPSQLTITANNSVTTFVTAIRTSLETAVGDMATSVVSDWKAAQAAASAGTLWQDHVDEWASTVWASGIEFVGTNSDGSSPGNALYLAQAVNMSLYSIISSVREDRPYSLSPGGLTPGYNGHTFWDDATWMYPPVLMWFPDIAASLMEYRYLRIPGAQEKARSYNQSYTGSMFPWESGFTGEEVCPSWAATGLREIHISGDIAFAVSQYWRMTQDIEWLGNRGRPLLSGIAEFWASKVEPNPSGGLAINEPTADEYEDHVNNSAYTNSVARLALEAAADADRTLGMPPASYTKWLEIAQQIVIPFNATTQTHPEFDGYHGQKIKQADVILMGFPLEVDFGNMTADVRRNDLLYYANVTDSDGPAMTWAMQSIGLLELGDTAGAASNFNRSFANQQEPYMVWTETPSGGTPNFITGAGGFLQAILFGYPGVRIRSSSLFIQPQLFENVASVKLRGIGYLGNRLNIVYDAASITFEVLPSSNVTVSGRNLVAYNLNIRDESTKAVQSLPAGTAVTLPIAPAGFSVFKA